MDLTQSFRRTPESRFERLAPASLIAWMPAFAGMTDFAAPVIVQS
jgi:hypothetical protein